MKALRSFHVPRAGGVAYAEAHSNHRFWKVVFPPSPCHCRPRESQDGAVGGASTDVESSLNLFEENTDGNKGGRIKIMVMGMQRDEIFRRRVYVGTHSFFDGTMDQEDTLHHIESVGPISFVYDWQNSEHESRDRALCR